LYTVQKQFRTTFKPKTNNAMETIVI
jgi:hypothetical protein